MKSPDSPVRSIQAVLSLRTSSRFHSAESPHGQCRGRAIVSGAFEPPAYKELTLPTVSGRVSKNGPGGPFLTA